LFNQEKETQMKPKFSLVYLLIFAFLLGACGPSTEEIAAMTASSWTPTPLPTDTPVPTPTRIPPLFRDDFESVLGDGWRFLGEDATHYSLTNAPGSLRIVAQPSNLSIEGRIRNFLIRDIPEGNFQIETLLTFEPVSNFQFAGLLIYQEQGKAMQFGRAFAQCNFAFCKGNAIYFDLFDPEATNPPNFGTVVNETSQVYLRLRREGNQYSGYYSADGVNWMLIGTHTSNIVPVSIGLIAAQGYEAEAPADFDYFIIDLVP